jgi:hypothetical protein
MSLASLLNPDEPAFAWEHQMAHRTNLGVMSPLTRFSVIPYWLDPLANTEQPASAWHLDHQQAHNDSALHLPSAYLGTAVGIELHANLVDYDLSNPEQRQWWAFQNQLEHFVGNNAILPQPQIPPPPPAPIFRFPFW